MSCSCVSERVIFSLYFCFRPCNEGKKLFSMKARRSYSWIFFVFPSLKVVRKVSSEINFQRRKYEIKSFHTNTVSFKFLNLRSAVIDVQNSCEIFFENNFPNVKKASHFRKWEFSNVMIFPALAWMKVIDTRSSSTVCTEAANFYSEVSFSFRTFTERGFHC